MYILYIYIYNLYMVPFMGRGVALRTRTNLMSPWLPAKQGFHGCRGEERWKFQWKPQEPRMQYMVLLAGIFAGVLGQAVPPWIISDRSIYRAQALLPCAPFDVALH